MTLGMVTVNAAVMKLPTVSDMGELPDTLLFFRLPVLPFNLATLQVILPVALTLSAVGRLESFLAASVLDDLTAAPL